MRKSLFVITLLLAVSRNPALAQSASFATYTNPVIPGDHPDCTLTKIGNDFFTTGSSFNPTPVIYHSTDLVHWEAIAQPVSAAWSGYGDAPAGGCWGGQMVYHGGTYWDFFSRGNVMYFVTAANPRGPWSMPIAMSTPAGVPGLGYDNSIFIDDDGNWYLLVKNGQVNNWIVQLGSDGQPGGAVYDLTWINPAPGYPYSWAEGPVMWKHNGFYYYSFALNVAGGQKVFRSSALTDSQSSWVNLGDFFNLNDPLKSQAVFQNPNHNSAAVMLDDSTSWVVHPLWRSGNSNEWYGQGRQGLLNQVLYDGNGKPTADFPVNQFRTAPRLPSSGIPWMVPHSDYFDSVSMNPEWSFLGYTPTSSYSLTHRPGWLTLSPKGKPNTVIKNDGEHNYAIITRVDFQPASVSDQAGIWVFNGLQTLSARLYSSMDSTGKKIVGFSYKTTSYQINAPVQTGESIVWLKLVRVNHLLSGFGSVDGKNWIPVGATIDVTDMDGLQSNYNAWTGNRQGLYVQGNSADFDLYIYRDAYTPILAECPANQSGTALARTVGGIRPLQAVTNQGWALYAGVDFGNAEYQRTPDSLELVASCAATGGTVEVWLDSLGTGTRIAQCSIGNTGSANTFQSFRTNIAFPVRGTHDIYLRFVASGSDTLFAVQWLTFLDGANRTMGVRPPDVGSIPVHYELEQNFPNPFNPTTVIRGQWTVDSWVTLNVYDVLGRLVATLANGRYPAGTHAFSFNASGLSSGAYFYRLEAGNYSAFRSMLVLK